MVFNKKVFYFLLGLALVLLAAGLAVRQALAHGSMGTPISRVYNCYLEGPENPVSAACKAAVALGGTQALYDWNGVRQGNANGNHQALIPDGKLCSANNYEFRGLDLARDDWVATTLPTSGSYTFRFRATAPHRGTMYLYVTRNGYNPTQPLRWSDLEASPFSSYVTGSSTSGGYYSWSAQLPGGKSGRHLIYMIWQRSDSPEAFYSCSDVIFGSGSGGPSATPTRTLTRTATSSGPTVTPSRTPTRTATLSGPTATFTRTATLAGGVQAWAPWTSYAVGQLVTYNGFTYRCLQGHTSQPGWEPPNVPALWQVNN